MRHPNIDDTSNTDGLTRMQRIDTILAELELDLRVKSQEHEKRRGREAQKTHRHDASIMRK